MTRLVSEYEVELGEGLRVSGANDQSGADSVEITDVSSVPYWHITSITDPNDLKNLVEPGEDGTGGPLGDLM